ncbi:MAG: phospho-sugar mutase [Propionibacteriaceae bacterium]
MADSATVLSTELSSSVAAWRAQDPDPGTRAALDDLLSGVERGEAAALAELTDAFAGRLEFGTAGLRAALGPGPRRMNRVVVGQAAAGLATYLLDQGLRGGRVLVGYDARHQSDVFATDTAAVMTAAGFEVVVTDGPTPTPVVAFGIGYLDCVAAVVVTASHNPPQDNGYKVYLGDGSQIVPPADAEISARIEEITQHDLADVPRATNGWQVGGPELTRAYLARVAGRVPSGPRALSWVYTPLHGVGGGWAASAAAAAGFPPAVTVEQQALPDPDFPTLAFPNPEEPGALDLALARAAEVGADLVVANDPDADRCAVALPGPDPHDRDGWAVLRGDDLGALLGDDALRRGLRGTYACSIVSSSLLAEMALAHSEPFVSTLTGFKWIGRVPGLVFGYEEALGYCCDPAAVPDKDGLSALVTVLGLAARLKAAGQTLAGRLDDIARRYGLHRTDQLSVRRDDPAEITAAVQRLRDQPPYRLLDQSVTTEDLAPGSPGLPPTDAVRIVGDSLSVVVRPSGTEPKLKCYLEVRLTVGETTDLVGAHELASAQLAQLRAELTDALGLA